MSVSGNRNESSVKSYSKKNENTKTNMAGSLMAVNENVFSAGMKLIQFISTLFFVFCWSTLLGRVSRDFVIGWCLVFKASESS